MLMPRGSRLPVGDASKHSHCCRQLCRAGQLWLAVLCTMQHRSKGGVKLTSHSALSTGAGLVTVPFHAEVSGTNTEPL